MIKSYTDLTLDLHFKKRNLVESSFNAKLQEEIARIDREFLEERTRHANSQEVSSQDIWRL